MKLCDYNELVDMTDIELTPKEAILFKCHECCAFDSVEVKACESKTCPLYKFKQRWYKTPRKFSEETLAMMSERLKSSPIRAKSSLVE